MSITAQKMQRVIGGRFNMCALRNYYFVTLVSTRTNSGRWGYIKNPTEQASSQGILPYGNYSTNHSLSIRSSVLLVHNSIPFDLFSQSRPPLGECTPNNYTEPKEPWGYLYTRQLFSNSTTCIYEAYYLGGPANEPVTLPGGSYSSRGDYGGVTQTGDIYHYNKPNYSDTTESYTLLFTEEQQRLFCEAVKERPTVFRGPMGVLVKEYLPESTFEPQYWT
jgi:hypothetical protein